ncbi:MAG: NADH-quinone oxidoreductase subunit NuoE [Planctomycetes bacterium]|nr:NADH-quinone oxidoreductase subunit NuoE [Planctomycetota bacterium]
MTTKDTNGKLIEKLMARYNGRKDVLISLLQDIQSENNWLSEESIRDVAQKLRLPLTDVYGVATFFKAFSLKPRGKHIVTACLGTACHVRGAPRLVDELQKILGVEPGETTPDKMFTLETVNCLGACALGPVVVIDGVYHGHATKSKVKLLIEEMRKSKQIKKRNEYDKDKKLQSA